MSDLKDKAADVVVFDLDGTVIRGDSYVAFLLGFLKRNPTRVFRVAFLPFFLSAYWCGFRDNSWLKVRFLSAIMGGAARSQIELWAEMFARDLVTRAIKGRARDTIERHRQEGARLVLATASLDLYVEPFSRLLGFDHTVCTKVAWTDDGRLDGRLLGGNCYGDAKLAGVNALMLDEDLPAITIAYSDHHDDLPLLKAAKCGIVVSPTKQLAKCAGDLGLRCEEW